MAEQVKRIILKCKLHFKGVQLHPIQLCAIVLKKLPHLGQLTRGNIKSGKDVVEHFWIEDAKGSIYDPTPLYFDLPFSPEYHTDAPSDTVVRSNGSEELWDKRNDLFASWDKVARGKLSKVLRTA